MAKKRSQELPADASNQIREDILMADLSEHAERAYLEYAMSVVKGRAIPSVEDGLKPVQRRILFAMRELSLSSSSKPKKSARVVGDVIGKYHPHGDSAVYEAMVRTAQNFSLRYPLVHGEGNFGSRDGDPAAAMRYTEAKMTPFAETFLSELGMGSVDWRSNYDNTMEEPQTLPARLPNILLNGAPGIGVGIATEIPPHNLREAADACIAFIKKPKIGLDEILQILPAPDFPTGGQIISSPEDIRRAYAEGKGSIRVRARYLIEGEGTKNWKLVVYELPYHTSTQQVMEEIDRIFNPKPKEKGGKKTFSPEQLRQKALFSSLIEKFADASDKDNPLRLTVEPKNHKQDPQELINALLAYTSMEMNCPINLVAVGLDKTPRQKTLVEIISEWTQYRITTVERRTRYEHDVASRRLHILQGRATILDHIEEVVKILKSADDPKAALMERFGLSEVQAEDVMEIRLRQLARLERQKIEEEIKKLEAEIARLSKLLANPSALRAQVIKEIEADKKEFGDDRRTIIQADSRTEARAVEDTAISDDPVTIAISERGWIRAKAGHQHDMESFAFKAGDAVREMYRVKQSDHVVFLDESGKSYSCPVRDLPSAKGGEDVPIAKLADFGAKLAWTIAGSAEERFVVASDAGYGFICKISDMITRLRAGKSLLTLPEGSKPVLPCKVPAGIDPEQTAFVALSSNSRLLAYRLGEIADLPRGKGLALLGLDEGQTLQQIAILRENRLSYRIGDGKAIRMPDEEFAQHVQSRSSSKKGKPVAKAKGKPITLVADPISEETPAP